MAASNINRITFTGNLTADPDLRSTSTGTSVCNLRVANNVRVKRGDEWVDKTNYIDVVVWAAQGENCAKYLSKGRPVAVDGHWDFQEWEDKDTGKKRSKIVAVVGRDGTVVFLPSPRDDDGGQRRAPSQSGQPEGGDFGTPSGGGNFGTPSTTAPADDDIPF